MALANEKAVSLGEFFDLIYKETEGVAYIATKNPKSEHDFKQKFFNWPSDRAAMENYIQQNANSYEVYYAPALFKSESGTKEEVLGANVAWCEFDGNTPTELNGIPEPSIRIISSLEGHEHWYWMLSEFTHPYDLEKINKKITYATGADTSGWDANQILRPIGTINHKRQKSVRLRSVIKEEYSALSFQHLPEPSGGVDIPVPTSLPDVNTVIAINQIPLKVWGLFTRGKPEGHRSEALMELAYSVAELGLKNEEIFAFILNADNRWGKYAGRPDQLKRITDIVSRARSKYPSVGVQQETSELLSSVFSLKEFMETEVNIEWVWDGLFQRGGQFLLSGAPGLGKTQLSLQASYSFLLGGKLFGREITPVNKVGIFSMEMGHTDLKQFLNMQLPYYSEEERERLNEGLVIFPLGESIFLDKEDSAKKFEEAVMEQELDGIFIDSLGSCVSGSLSDDTAMRAFMSWSDSFRNRTGKFIWYIHHNRKATGDNKKPKKLADIFGSQYITGRSSSVVTLYGDPTVNKNKLEFIPLKIRMGPQPNAMNIYRTEHLLFTDKNIGLSYEQVKDKMPSKKLSLSPTLGGFSPNVNPDKK